MIRQFNDIAYCQYWLIFIHGYRKFHPVLIINFY